MATHHGNEGAVYIGANAIAEVTAWSYSESIDLVEDSAIGDTTKTYKTGLKDGSGSVTCHWDETDTSGQLAATVGASITLNLYPEGNTSGDAYYTGTVIVESVEVSGDMGSIVGRTIGFKGALTAATVGA